MIALDSNVFIYALEGNEEFGEDARQLLNAAANGVVAGNASELVYLEVLTGTGGEKPARNLLEGIDITYQPVTLDVLLKAVGLRRRYALKTPDAVHVASALAAGCTYLVTNDRTLARHKIPGVDIISLKAAVKLIQ
ncbi:MAG: type II toxin-antitoxin system VapC family toxin [Candidatus Saccharimonadales bacterium]